MKPIAGAVLLIVAGAMLKSLLPDITRYLKMKNM